MKGVKSKYFLTEKKWIKDNILEIVNRRNIGLFLHGRLFHLNRLHEFDVIINSKHI